METQGSPDCISFGTPCGPAMCLAGGAAGPSAAVGPPGVRQVCAWGPGEGVEVREALQLQCRSPEDHNIAAWVPWESPSHRRPRKRNGQDAMGGTKS